MKEKGGDGGEKRRGGLSPYLEEVEVALLHRK